MVPAGSPLLTLLIPFLTLLVSPLWASAAGPVVVTLTVDGAIGPATADYVHRGLSRAEKEGAGLVVIQLDTPGGLDTSMRKINKDILASPVPVATFVAPKGARAASAGTYILYASHIAAMAPATNLGAATPIQIGGAPEPGPAKKPPGEEKGEKAAEKSGEGEQSTLTRKQVHDAAAYIRGLAQMRGRNAEWAEKAVQEAASLSADEAKKIQVVDLIAQDVPDLLRQLEGRTVNVLGHDRQLHLANAVTIGYEPDWRSRLLAVITDPSIALILMMIGVYGLFFEFYNPGFVLPGVVGAICLLLGLFALQLLPVNYAGLGLIMLGIAFLIAEAFLATFGVLGVGGIIAFVLGAVMLVDTDVPGFGIPWALIIMLALVSAGFVIFVGGMAAKARARPVVTGHEQLIGSVGEVLEANGSEGWARVHGESWQIRGSEALRRGESVMVKSRTGLVLEVSPIAHQDKGG